MERYLKPEKLKLDVKDSTQNEESVKHWIKTFENFLAAVIASDASRNTDANKLGLLTSHVSYAIFKHIEAATTYDDAINYL